VRSTWVTASKLSRPGWKRARGPDCSVGDAGKRARATVQGGSREEEGRTFHDHRRARGIRAPEACFEAFGPPPIGGGHACAKLKPLSYKAYPFKITGARQRFSVQVTWFTKKPGSGKGFKKAASSFLKVRP
jgi:hypothetical protein